MSEPSRPDAGRQPPQAPFDLWRTTPAGGRQSSFPVLWVILIVALVGLFGTGFWFRPWNGPARPADPRAKSGPEQLLERLGPPEYRPSPEELPLQEAAKKIFGGPSSGGDAARGPAAVDPAAASRAAEAERRRTLLDAKATQRNALAAGVRTREALARWQSELDRWDSAAAKLLDGDDGRTVAGGEDLVRQFRAVYQAERPSRAELDEAREAVGQLLGPIELAVHDPEDPLRPGQDVVRSLESRATQASQAAARWKEAVQEANALATLARRRGLSGKSTLRQALGDLEDELAVGRAREKQAKLAEAERKASETDAAIAAAKVTDAAAMRKAQAEAERKKLVEAADRRRQREFARGDEIRRYLGSLMAKGFTQPIPSGNMAFPRKADEEGPVSLAALRNSGCLEPGLTGQARLVCFMVHPDMDRPRWGMHAEQELWKPDQQRFIGQAHKLLIEYGEAMVDEGLLAR